MNFYMHHLGDYALATAHLSWDEDMAYTRMLRLYYQTERPLPNDFSVIARLIGSGLSVRKRNKLEHSISLICFEYFTLEADGWHQKRCDKEIQIADNKREKARINGLNGGRPKNPEKPTSVILETQKKASQTPIPDSNPRLQTSSELKDSSSEEDLLSFSAQKPPQSDEPNKPRNGHAKSAWMKSATEILAFMNKTLGTHYRATNPDGRATANAELIVNRLKQGYTEADLTSVFKAKADQWFGDDKMQDYLRPETLFGARKFQTYIGQLPQEYQTP